MHKYLQNLSTNNLHKIVVDETNAWTLLMQTLKVHIQ
jgi:hypothetical protein